MDPIEPIRPSISAPGRVSGVPVERLERISRERDRPSQERPGARRRQPPPGRSSERDDADEDGPGDDHPHVDVRA